MRQSEAAVSLIHRVQEGQTFWLAQWNPNWRRFHFVSGHRRAEESFRECLVREIAEELGLREGADYQVLQAHPAQLDFFDFSESSRAETRYIMGLFNVQLKPGTDREVDANPANR
jgi:8-oxo-dGTP pyrophosphatase MutT (NUDIX family)